MKTRLVIFDLDGTLLDTSPGIMESVRYAADKLGYPQLSERQLLSFVGPPLRVSFRRCYGCSEEEADRLTEAFREKFREGAVLNATPYEGIFDLLRDLKHRGLSIAVATSKPQPFAEQILQHFGFDKYIDVIHGADMEGKLTKADVIHLCTEKAGATSDECVMVGDTEHDAKGAAEAGVPFIAVTYGFGNRDEMMKWPSVGIADRPIEIILMLTEM